MSSNFYIFFNTFTLINLLVLFIILFFRKNNSMTNRLLALIIINPGLNFINNILIQSGYIFDIPYTYFFFQGTMLLYAPLVMAYVLTMMGQKFRLVSVLNALTLLVILLDVYYAIQFSLLNEPQQHTYLQNLTSENYPQDMQTLNMLFVLLMLLYFIVTLVKVFKSHRVAKDFYSDIEKTKIQYARHFIVLLTILNVLLTLAYTLFATPTVEYFYIPFFINIIYLYVVYYAFRHSAILNKTEFCNLVSEAAKLENYKELNEPLCQEIKAISESRNKSKYKLTEIEIDSNHKKLIKYMEEEKPYLDPNINLTKLSSAINACSHNISLTLNIKFKQNFFDFINSYRVEEAKRLLNDLKNTQFTVEAVGFDSGFNSKASFYRAFKKYTQLTPTEYLNRREKEK